MSIPVAMQALVSALIGVAIVGVVAGARGPGSIGPRSTRLSRHIAPGIEVPGVAIAITRNRDVVCVAGYGQDSSGVAITAKTRLPIASLSKSFTSLAVMQLVEAGRVNLDAPVRDYVRDFSVAADTRGGAITVRHLLTHTSGLSDKTFAEKSGPLPASLREGVALLGTARLKTTPGEKAHYHNPNYWVAARLVEVVSGMSFAAEHRAASHLHALRHARVYDGCHTDRRTRPGQGHIRFFGALLTLPEPAWFLDGASGVVTTAEDLAQWLIMQNNAGVAANGTRIISAVGVSAMHAGTRVERQRRRARASGPAWWLAVHVHRAPAAAAQPALRHRGDVERGVGPCPWLTARSSRSRWRRRLKARLHNLVCQLPSLSIWCCSGWLFSRWVSACARFVARLRGQLGGRNSRRGVTRSRCCRA